MPSVYLEHFATLTDEELLKKLAPGQLLDEAYEVARAEATSRNLSIPQAECASELFASDGYHGDFVAVARLLEATEAHVLQAYLESCEIPAIVADVNLAQANQLLTGALGGASVKVPSRFAENARELLNQFNKGQAALPGDTVEGMLETPRSRLVAQPVNEKQKSFLVYAHPDRSVHLVVKKGFSWGAFIFGPLWFLVHGMWSYFFIVAMLYVGGNLYFQNHVARGQSDGWLMLGAGGLYLLTWFVIGKLANSLLSGVLEEKGYRLIATVRAKNATYARDEAMHSPTQL